MYWMLSETDNDAEPGIYKAGLDGQNVEHVANTTASNPTLDKAGQNIYGVIDRHVIRVTVDEGAVDTVLTGSSIRTPPNDLIFDQLQNKLMWVEGRSDGEAGFRIM